MKHFVLRVEGVNFDKCLFDTNDLSVVRGASLLLDQVAVPVAEALTATLGTEVKPDWAGGSKAVFRFQATETQATAAEASARASLARDPWAHMTFVLDMVEDLAGGMDGELVAEARNHSRQFRQWTVADCRVAGAWRQDVLDGVRPADPAGTDPTGPLSPASVARRAPGQAQRRGFFQEMDSAILPKGTVFIQSFEDMVQRPPDGLSLSAKGKIAVIHLDGDGFGAAATALGDAVQFSKQLADKSRDVITKLVADALAQEVTEVTAGPATMRLEVLVWGGDDVTLVVPAWRAMATLRTFYEAVAGWEIKGNPLGYTGAAIIASYKAPIRRLVHLANEAVDLAKRADARGGCSFDIFESASPPEDGLLAHRARAHPGVEMPKLVFPGPMLGELAEMVSRFKSESGKLYPSRARLHDLLKQNLSDVDLMAELHRDESRVRGAARNAVSDLAHKLYLPCLDAEGRSLATNLRLICELWDYAPVAT